MGAQAASSSSKRQPERASQAEGAARRSRAPDVTPEINVTPLVDVVLVLLIIYIDVTPKLHRVVEIEHPQTIFHKKGVLAAARQGDNVNPERRSSASQFYIVQGRTFTDKELDSVEVVRLNGYKLPQAHRQVYKTIGGTPQLDHNYTVFGEVVKGIEVIDSIASEPTSKGVDRDRPLKDVRILHAKLVKRKKHTF